MVSSPKHGRRLWLCESGSRSRMRSTSLNQTRPAADWLEHRQAAQAHAAACSQIKELIESDVARAFGHGVEARRSKAGAISIRELRQ